LPDFFILNQDASATTFALCTISENRSFDDDDDDLDMSISMKPSVAWRTPAMVAASNHRASE
jgi:hypothetical protein